MKKFFKALALVLALVLVIGAIPASAATNFSLKKDTKIVYLGGAQGLKEDGTKCATTSKYRISKLINGFDAETMYLKLESSDVTVVKTKDSKRKVYGKSIGEATVTVYIYDKESDALLDTLQPTVKVKKNATTIQYAVKDANDGLVDPTEKFGLNTPYTVILSRKDADGKLTDTDYRAITCVSDNKADVEITPANEYTTKYTVTFKKAGSFDFVFATYQSKIWNAPIIAVPFTVVAGYTPVDAKQVALNAAAVTFESNVTGLTADNFNAYYEVKDADGTITKVYPTAAQTVVCKDNVATVTFLSDFIPGLTYFIEYDGNVAGSFDAAKITADSADHIEIPAQEVTVGVPSKLSFKIVDANGIDIKSLLGTTLTGILTFELEKGDIDTYITSGYEPEVYIGTVGKSYTVKAVYTWIDANGKEQKAEGTGLVASVAATPWKMGQVAGLISDEATAKDYIVDGKVNADAKAIEHWAIGDAVVLQIGVPYTKGNDKGIEAFDTAGSVAGEYKAYKLLSSNDNVVMVGEAVKIAGSTKENAYRLIANKEGGASIVVYGVKADDSTVAIGVIGVNVEKARTATTFTVTPSKKSINAAFDGDTITFKLNVKDQYGADMTKAIKVEVINKTSTTPTFAFDDPNHYNLTSGVDFTVNGTAFSDKGTVNLKFSVEGTSLVQTLVLDVGNEAAAKTYVLKLGGTTLDTGITNAGVADQDVKTVDIKLEGKTASGYVTSGTAIVYSATAYKTRSTTSGVIDGPVYYYNVYKNGSLVDLTTNTNFAANVFTNIVAGANAPELLVPGSTVQVYDSLGNPVKPVTYRGNTTLATSSTAAKLAAGTYTITAYSQTLNAAGDTIVVSQIGTQNLVVTDNQLQGTFVRKDNAESLANVIDEDQIRSAYTIKFNGVEITDAIFEFTPNNDTDVASSTSAFVKTATFYVGNANVNYQKIVVEIGEVVRKG
jgi:hypothetical protein